MLSSTDVITAFSLLTGQAILQNGCEFGNPILSEHNLREFCVRKDSKMELQKVMIVILPSQSIGRTVPLHFFQNTTTKIY